MIRSPLSSAGAHTASVGQFTSNVVPCLCVLERETDRQENSSMDNCKAFTRWIQLNMAKRWPLIRKLIFFWIIKLLLFLLFLRFYPSNQPPANPDNELVILCSVNRTEQQRQTSVGEGSPADIYFVTPTNSRVVQLAELTRLGNTLGHVRRLHWILVEDSDTCSPLISNLLRRSGTICVSSAVSRHGRTILYLPCASIFRHFVYAYGKSNSVDLFAAEISVERCGRTESSLKMAAG